MDETGQAHRAGLRSGRRPARGRASRPGEQCEFLYPSWLRWCLP